MKKNANKGFSLVELIIVIAIMAVLIGVLAPQFIKQVEKSRESTDLQNIEEVKTAIETYAADHGESLSGEIKIEVAANGASVTITPAGVVTGLGEYGIGTISMKSKKWDAFSWTYSLTDYKWTGAGSQSRTYFDINGSVRS